MKGYKYEGNIKLQHNALALLNPVVYFCINFVMSLSKLVCQREGSGIITRCNTEVSFVGLLDYYILWVPVQDWRDTHMQVSALHHACEKMGLWHIQTNDIDPASLTYNNIQIII